MHSWRESSHSGAREVSVSLWSAMGSWRSSPNSKAKADISWLAYGSLGAQIEGAHSPILIN